MVINNNVDLVKQNGDYFVYIIKSKAADFNKEAKLNELTMCGIDPGIRTFATMYSLFIGYAIFKLYLSRIKNMPNSHI